MFFNILWNILQIFMFFVGLLYTLLINNLLITTTDTYRLYISNTVYCNKQWECNSNNNKRSAGCVSDWKPSDFLSVCLRLCVYLIGLKGFTVGEEEISDNWYFFCECGLFAPQLQTRWTNLWLICKCEFYCFLCRLSVWDAQKSHPTRGDQVQANRKAVFSLFVPID